MTAKPRNARVCRRPRSTAELRALPMRILMRSLVCLLRSFGSAGSLPTQFDNPRRRKVNNREKLRIADSF